MTASWETIFDADADADNNGNGIPLEEIIAELERSLKTKTRPNVQ